MAADECIIFYSWASDHPASTTRSLIEKALQRAVNDLHSDETIKVVPVIDRDTQGVPGSPDIASTIFGKIDQAQVFVCDISIVDPIALRPAPNPNVLIELGYALKTLGHKRVIMVMNTVFGGPDLLPFDLRVRRVTPYYKPEDSNDQGEARKQLQSVLADALRAILQGIDQPLSGESISSPTPAQKAHESIEANRPDMDERVRQYMASLGEQIVALTPKGVGNDQAQWEENLLGAIDASVPFVLEFTQLAQTANAYKATEALNEIYEGFSNILDLYRTPPGYSGSFNVSDFDLPRFLGHELFVTFCALLLRSKRWESLATLLDKDIYVANGEYHEPGTMPFTALSEFVRLLEARNDRLKLNRSLLHADLLKERHAESGPLAQALPMTLFTAADYFLYLRGQLAPDTVPQHVSWKPWSIIYLHHPPRFLMESAQKAVAESLTLALNVPTVDELRRRFIQRAPTLENLFGAPFWHNPLRDFNPGNIGTR